MTGRAKQALTQRAVDAARATGKPYVLGDAACHGLRLWVGKTGTRRWQRQEGSQTIILGDAAVIPLTEARALATGPIKASAVEARTIGGLIAAYLQSDGLHLAKNTARPRVLRFWFADLLDRPLAALTREAIIARQRDLLAKGYRGSSVVTYQNAAKAFSSWCVDRGYLDRSPCRKLPRVPVDESFWCLDDRDTVLLESACDGYPEPGIAALAMIALNCGLRKGEIISLEWSDFDWDRRQLTVRAGTTKTRRGRVVPLPRKLMEFLFQCMPDELRPTERRWNQPPANPRQARLPVKRPFAFRSVDRRWRALRATAKLSTHCTIHALRHSFASTVLRRGADLVQIKSVLGHSSVSVTERYLHKLECERCQVADLIDAGPVATSSLLKVNP